MQGCFLKSYNLTVKQMGGKKVHKKKYRGREKHEIQTGLRPHNCWVFQFQIEAGGGPEPRNLLIPALFHECNGRKF